MLIAALSSRPLWFEATIGFVSETGRDTLVRRAKGRDSTRVVSATEPRIG
jgi:hypothetical protein